MIFLFVHILFIIIVNATEPFDTNGYISECHLINQTHLTFICEKDFRQTNFFDASVLSECSNGDAFEKDRILEINFENCSMSSIGKPVFEVYKSMKIFNVSHAGLGALQKELFREAKKLTKLNASYNNIVELSSFMFVNAVNLSEADFSFNSIHRVDTFAFAGDSKMETLNFSHNKIAVLQKQLFGYLPKLEHLNLSHNAITNLDELIFDNLTNLLTLDLSFNNIEKLNINIFAALKKLQILNLSDAKLSTIDPKTFSHQIELRILDLSRNNLKVLDVHIFDGGVFLPKFDNLKLLLIGGNVLHELNGFSSVQFPAVKIRGLSHNAFECCDLRKLLRLFEWKQLDLELDEHSNHPNMTDSKGFKCDFGNNSMSDTEIGEFSWSEILAVACMLLVTLLFVIIISIFKRVRNFEETRLNMETIAVQCDAGQTRRSSSNVYDSPKF